MLQLLQVEARVGFSLRDHVDIEEGEHDENWCAGHGTNSAAGVTDHLSGVLR